MAKIITTVITCDGCEKEIKKDQPHVTMTASLYYNGKKIAKNSKSEKFDLHVDCVPSIGGLRLQLPTAAEHSLASTGSKRTYQSHKECKHPATKYARKVCRDQRLAG